MLLDTIQETSIENVIMTIILYKREECKVVDGDDDRMTHGKKLGCRVITASNSVYVNVYFTASLLGQVKT